MTDRLSAYEMHSFMSTCILRPGRARGEFRLFHQGVNDNDDSDGGDDNS
jgi:hypothetical protein